MPRHSTINLKNLLMVFMCQEFAKMSLRTYDKSAYLDTQDHKFSMLSKIVLGFSKSYIAKSKANKKQINRLINHLSESFDVEIEFLKSKCEGTSSPQMLLVLTLDRLVNIRKDKQSMMYFKPLDLNSYTDYIYSKKEYQEKFKQHNDFLDRVLEMKI